MKGLRYWCLMGCMGAALLAAPAAHAADGRITFSGAILEATCMADAADIVSSSGSYAETMSRVRCAGHESNAGQKTGPSYRLDVSTLGALAGDPLLTYFAGYTLANGSGASRLLTQTFD